MHADSSPSAGFSPWEIFVLGLKVLGSEMSWLFIRLARSMEIRQLNKRLEREYARLGRISGDSSEAGGGDEQDLTYRQIEFLRREIEFLEEEREKARQEHVRRRVKRWELDSRV